MSISDSFQEEKNKHKISDFLHKTLHTDMIYVNIYMLTQMKETRGIFGNFIELKHRK